MLLIALALAQTSAPERWVRVVGEPGLFEEYLDRESIERSGHKVTLWTRRDAARDRSTVWQELELDCSAKTATILAYVRDDAGTISHNVARPHREASPIVAGSVEERIFRMACAGLSGT